MRRLHPSQYEELPVCPEGEEPAERARRVHEESVRIWQEMESLGIAAVGGDAMV
jgi:hypothetical protein